VTFIIDHNTHYDSGGSVPLVSLKLVLL